MSPPSKGNCEENFSHDPDSRRIEKSMLYFKSVSTCLPTYLKFKVTLLSGLGNVHREVGFKKVSNFKIILCCSGQPVLSGENKKEAGLENLEEIS